MDGANLTLKQRKFIKEYIETGNGTQAVINAGYNVKDRKSAKSIAHENFSKLDLIDNKLLLKEQGLDLPSLLKDLRKGKEANKPIVMGDKIAEYPDHSVRHKYIDTLLKLGDYYPSEKHEIKEDKSVKIEIVENRELIEGQAIEVVDGDTIDTVDDSESIESIL